MGFFKFLCALLTAMGIAAALVYIHQHFYLNEEGRDSLIALKRCCDEKGASTMEQCMEIMKDREGKGKCLPYCVGRRTGIVTEDGSFSYYALTKETNEEIRAIKKECARSAEPIGDKCAKYQEIVNCVTKHMQRKAA